MIEHYQIWCLFFAHYCFFRVGSRHPLTYPNFLLTGICVPAKMFNNHLQHNYFEFGNQKPILFFFLQVDRRRLQEWSGDAGHSEELLQYHEAPQVRIAMMI